MQFSILESDQYQQIIENYSKDNMSISHSSSVDGIDDFDIDDISKIDGHLDQTCEFPSPFSLCCVVNFSPVKCCFKLTIADPRACRFSQQH